MHTWRWVRRQPIVRGDAGIPQLSKIHFQGLDVIIGDPGMMSYKLGDRLGGPQVPQKGTFVLAPDLSMLDAELKVRGQEASGGREEEHAAQRNKGRQAIEFPDEVESEQRHDRRGRIATVEDRVSPRIPAQSEPGDRHARHHVGSKPDGSRIASKLAAC